jgi:integrase
VKGHIRERSPGHWAIILDTRDPETGKRKRKWHKFKGTKRQAQVECSRLITAMDAGTYMEPSKTTVATFLERWLEHMQPLLSPLSHERYCEVARKNVMPLLGAVVLTKLRPVQISEAYGKALNSGRRDGKGGLSPQSVLHIHRLLRQALAQAVRWDLLPRNPTDAVSPPKVERRRLTTYDMEQTAELLDALRATRMHIPVLLAILCGLRRGEIAALRWRDVDLFRNMGAQLAVVSSAEQTKAGVRYKEPKSGRSRTVALSGTVVQELRSHRIAQAQELLRVGVRLSDETFVVAQADGSPLQPRSLTHEWMRLIAGTALPRMRFHDLRHAHATHLLSNGVHPKVASERLGHSKVGITLDLYSHVLPGMQEDAAARVDDALSEAIQKRAAKPIG